MKTSERAIPDSGPLALLALLTTYGMLSSNRRAPETNAPAKTKSRGLLDRFDDWLWRHEMRRHEEYLARSVDIVDLEYRQRALERGKGA